MKRLKLFEEYKYFKVNRSKYNVHDPNEPFFNRNKYGYKEKKRREESIIEDENKLEPYKDILTKYKTLLEDENNIEQINLYSGLIKLNTEDIIKVKIYQWDEADEYTLYINNEEIPVSMNDIQLREKFNGNNEILRLLTIRIRDIFRNKRKELQERERKHKEDSSWIDY